MLTDAGLAGAIDLHLHLGPDPVVPRMYDIEEGARRAAAAQMGGFVVKSHSYDTSALTRVVGSHYPSMIVAGGITLDPPVGGLNPRALDVAASLGARMVWMPTQGRLSVMSADDPAVLAPEMNEILAIVREHGLILASGHLPADEIRVLVPKAVRLGIEKIVVTHAMNRRVGPELSIPVQKELVGMGAFIEHCYTTTLPPSGVPCERIAEAIRATGPDRVVVSTDLGKRTNVDPFTGFEIFIGELLKAGLPRQAVDRMTKINPAYLLSPG